MNAATKTAEHLEDLNIEFHETGLAASDGALEIGHGTYGGARLATLRAALGHAARPLDVLKIDIEGGEWAALPELLAECERAVVAHQILVELHSPKLAGFLALAERLEQCGYRLFAKDYNLL